ncbi:hypothetical protein PRUPE_7G010000 [Prunus persica]|uniref:Uncharacterized protein n=1 Tax=Prunus persica TaxID=3760 RepID=A0A251N4P3_PRUPE|nr:hypothetical protein PRUPE_7G010000 [Prunus persica]
MVFFLNVPSLVWLYVGNQKQKIITKYKKWVPNLPINCLIEKCRSIDKDPSIKVKQTREWKNHFYISIPFPLLSQSKRSFRKRQKMFW